MDLIERSALLKDLDDLKKSPWYNTGNPFIQQGMRECMDMIETQCIKKALAEDAIPVEWIQRKIDMLEQNMDSGLPEDAMFAQLHELVSLKRLVTDWEKEKWKEYESLQDM